MTLSCRKRSTLPLGADEHAEDRKLEIRSGIAEGLRSLRRGERVDGGEFFAQLELEERDFERSLKSA